MDGRASPTLYRFAFRRPSLHLPPQGGPALLLRPACLRKLVWIAVAALRAVAQRRLKEWGFPLARWMAKTAKALACRLRRGAARGLGRAPPGRALGRWQRRGRGLSAPARLDQPLRRAARRARRRPADHDIGKLICEARPLRRHWRCLTPRR